MKKYESTFELCPTRAIDANYGSGATVSLSDVMIQHDAVFSGTHVLREMLANAEPLEKGWTWRAEIFTRGNKAVVVLCPERPGANDQTATSSPQNPA